MKLTPEKLSEMAARLVTNAEDQVADCEDVGKHRDAPDKDFDKKQLEMGIDIEKEHTDDKGLRKEISKDHLVEIPDYYTHLEKMENQVKEKGRKESMKSKKYLKSMLTGMFGAKRAFNLIQKIAEEEVPSEADVKKQVKKLIKQPGMKVEKLHEELEDIGEKAEDIALQEVLKKRHR